MSHGPRHRVKPRRRREGKTDYRQRLRLLKSGETRIVVRRSLKNIRIQFVTYDEHGDKIIAQAMGTELAKTYGWKHSTSTTPVAYLTGLLAGKRAKKAGLQSGVLDIGRQRPVKGSKIFAALQGVLDAGVDCPHSDSKLPSPERINGKHIDEKLSADVSTIKEKIVGGT
ncbi:MAG: 50S ribosomal protein L18 [Thermoplasmatota archaeon]